MKKRRKNVKAKKVKRAKPVRKRSRLKVSRKPPRKRIPRRKVRKRVSKPKPVKRRKPTKAKRKRTNLKRRIRRDKERVFGQRRKRQPKEMPHAITQPDLGEIPFEVQLMDEQAKPEGAFAWTNEDEFIAQMERLGFSEREAYTLWFS